MKKILVTGGTTFVSKFVADYFVHREYEVYVLNRNTKPQVKVNYFSFYDYEYYLDVQRQQRLFSDTISLEEGLRESAAWYLANEAEVNKKPYIKLIDETLTSKLLINCHRTLAT
ncbi:MAG: hypothetical protein ACI4DU_05260 [Lachnospiraceae bacterium]